MKEEFKNVRAVGFDLDGTLYAQSPEMDETIVELFAGRVLEKRSDLKTLENAKEFSEKKYGELESRKRILEEVGYENAGAVMEGIFREADGSRFLARDEKLISLLEEIREAKEYLYLITTAPEEEARKKLAKLGVRTDIFDAMVLGDDPLLAQKPKNEVVFRRMIEVSRIAADDHVYVGDREKADVLAPRALGIKTIAVGSKIAAADASVATIYDIKELLF